MRRRTTAKSTNVSAFTRMNLCLLLDYKTMRLHFLSYGSAVALSLLTTLWSIISLSVATSFATAIAIQPINGTLTAPSTPFYDCFPPNPSRDPLSYDSCQRAVADFASTFSEIREYCFVHQPYLPLSNVISCPYLVRHQDCIFVVDYSTFSTFSPPANIGTVRHNGERLARACVQHGHGSGGTLDVEQIHMGQIWHLRLAMLRAKDPYAIDASAIDWNAMVKSPYTRNVAADLLVD